LLLVVALLGCEQDDAPAEGGTTAAETGTDAGPWWLGGFHDAMFPVGSNASLVTVGNLTIREDGTATGTALFCDDDPELAEYTWSMAGDTVTLAGDPLVWQGGVVDTITITQGAGCDEIAVAVLTLGGSTTNATYARGETCLEQTDPSCAVEVVWCADPPAECM
jgi:hypothetical protein